MKGKLRFFLLVPLAVLVLFLLVMLGVILSIVSDNPDDNPDPDDPPIITGNDWRTTGIVRASGTITRDGEDTPVLVCVHKSDSVFYYDEEDQMPIGGVEYPIVFGAA